VILPLQARYSVFQVAIALVAGLGLGFGGAALAYRYGLLPIPGERPFQRMARVLELTPTQREQVRDIMHDTRGKIDAARRGFEQQRHAIRTAINSRGGASKITGKCYSCAFGLYPGSLTRF
jgi:Spy/CpxP family protein refolding chaperone